LKNSYDYIITHKLVVAAAHWPGLCWQFHKGFPEPLLDTVLTSIQFVYFQYVRCSWVVRECVMLLFFCIFLYKAMWSTAHRYYSAVADHSVALKQSSPSSCIQELMSKETYLLTKTYVTQNIYKFNVAYRYKKYER